MSVSPRGGESPGSWWQVVPAQRSQGCPGKGWRPAPPGLRAATSTSLRSAELHLGLLVPRVPCARVSPTCAVVRMRVSGVFKGPTQSLRGPPFAGRWKVGPSHSGCHLPHVCPLRQLLSPPQCLCTCSSLSPEHSSLELSQDHHPSDSSQHHLFREASSNRHLAPHVDPHGSCPGT